MITFEMFQICVFLGKNIMTNWANIMVKLEIGCAPIDMHDIGVIISICLITHYTGHLCLGFKRYFHRLWGFDWRCIFRHQGFCATGFLQLIILDCACYMAFMNSYCTVGFTAINAFDRVNVTVSFITDFYIFLQIRSPARFNFSILHRIFVIFSFNRAIYV